jgi:hypothetical protein
MKTISFIGIFPALLLAAFTLQAQDADNDYYRNDDAKVIINNYYDNYGSDYYFSSRINRFHRSYAAFDYYSPVFTDTYWYDYRPWSWGISIYAGGLGFNLGYNPYYYGSYYSNWYDPYYFDPYYYDYWGYYPGCFSYWYTPPICWGLRSLWADLTWGWFRPFYWHHGWWNDFRGPYYSHHNNFYNDYSFRDYYRNEGRRFEASHDGYRSGSFQESRRGDLHNIQPGNGGSVRRGDQNVNGGTTRRAAEGIQNRGHDFRNNSSVNPGVSNRHSISRNQSQPSSRRYGNYGQSSSVRPERYSAGNSNSNYRRNSSGYITRNDERSSSSYTRPSYSGSNYRSAQGSLSNNYGTRRTGTGNITGSSAKSRSMSASTGHRTITRSTGSMPRSQGSISRSSGGISRSSSVMSRPSGGMSRSSGSISRSSGGGFSRSSGGGSRSSGSSGSSGSSRGSGRR